MRGIYSKRSHARYSQLFFTSKNKRGQVWVETVIYTLIGLAVIGLVLAGALPKINKMKDEVAIEQSLETLGSIDDKIYEVQRAEGSKRIVNLDIKKGKFIIDMSKNTISWTLDSSYAYSEPSDSNTPDYPGFPVMVGRINTTTTGTEKPYEIRLVMDYGFNLKYDGLDSGEKEFNVAPTPYKFSIENQGKESGNIVINFYDN